MSKDFNFDPLKKKVMIRTIFWQKIKLFFPLWLQFCLFSETLPKCQNPMEKYKGNAIFEVKSPPRRRFYFENHHILLRKYHILLRKSSFFEVKCHFWSFCGSGGLFLEGPQIVQLSAPLPRIDLKIDYSDTSSVGHWRCKREIFLKSWPKKSRAGNMSEPEKKRKNKKSFFSCSFFEENWTKIFFSRKNMNKMLFFLNFLLFKNVQNFFTFFSSCFKFQAYFAFAASMPHTRGLRIINF